jgi:hypothetical protein
MSHFFGRLRDGLMFAGAPPTHMLVHCCHHKAGTIWFLNVLGSIARRFKMRIQSCSQEELRPDTDIFMQHHSRVDLSALPPHRGSHVIRDPRDMVVSGYHYHLWTKESWAHEPRSNLGDRSFQQHLNLLSLEDGLHAEIERAARAEFPCMASWDYANPDFLEIKYEDLMSNELQVFERLFKHYGFGKTAMPACLKIVKRHSFSAVARRPAGEEVKGTHLRSGISGEWRTVLSEGHKDHFKHLTGDLLIRLGYETDANW